MINKFNMDNVWKEYELKLSCEYGFNQLSISNFIKNAKELITEKGCNKILDLGCGGGRHSFYFYKFGFEVHATDIDCKYIKENINRLNLDNITVKENSFTDIPYSSDFFDAVICTSTLHHALSKDIEKGINEIYRVLKPNGYFIFDILSREDNSYGMGERIDDNTFIGGREGEEGIPHHYTDSIELESFTNKFSYIDVNKSIYRFIMNQEEYISKCYEVMAIK